MAEPGNIDWDPFRHNDKWYVEELRLPGAKPGELSKDQMLYFVQLTDLLNNELDEATAADVAEWLYSEDCNQIREAFLAAPSNELSTQAKDLLNQAREEAQGKAKTRGSQPKSVAPDSDEPDVGSEDSPRGNGVPRAVGNALWEVLGYTDPPDVFERTGLSEAKRLDKVEAVMLKLHQLRLADEVNVVNWLRRKENVAIQKAFKRYLRGLNAPMQGVADSAESKESSTSVDNALWAVLGYSNVASRFGKKGLKAAKDLGLSEAVMKELHRLRKNDEGDVVGWLQLEENSAVERAFETYLRSLNKLGRSNSLTDGSSRVYAKSTLGGGKLRGGSRLTPDKQAKLKKEFDESTALRLAGLHSTSPYMIEWALQSKLNRKVVKDLLGHESKCALSTTDLDKAMRGLARVILGHPDWQNKTNFHVGDADNGYGVTNRLHFRLTFRKWVRKNIKDANERNLLLTAVPEKLVVKYDKPRLVEQSFKDAGITL